MKVLLVSQTAIPVYVYGGTERAIWDLGYPLSQLDHQVTYLVARGSTWHFAQVWEIEQELDLCQQIPLSFDIAHFQFNSDFNLDQDFSLPYVLTKHSNTAGDQLMPGNTIFVSKNQAWRYIEKFEHVLNGRTLAASAPRTGAAEGRLPWH